METPSNFNNKYTKLMKEMNFRMNQPEHGREIIEDGVMLIDKYFSNDIRLVWMLKEPYDEAEGKGGGWVYHDMFKVDDLYKKFSEGHKTTWHPIIYVSYSIQNNFQSWGELEYIRDKPEMCEVVKETAFINSQKLPAKGVTKTDHKDLLQSIEKYSDLLFRQIELLKPNVFIFANTIDLYLTMLELENIELIKSGSVEYFESGNKLYINAYHPAQTTIKREDYVDDIVLVVKNWFSNFNKTTPV